MLPLPLWVFVNLTTKAEEGFPYHFMTRGGQRTPLPLTLPVFSSEELAKRIAVSGPFVPREADQDTLLEFLTEAGDIEVILLDMGTPEATEFAVADVLNELGG